MKINVKYKPHREDIFVRRISWRQRCEEQLNQIIGELTNIKSNLINSKIELEEALHV